MRIANICPECESFDTERVHIHWYSDSIEEVRVCNDCPVQFTVEYGDPIKRVDNASEVA